MKLDMAIRIKTRPTLEQLTGRSHWWGAPDLPQEVPYPYVKVNDGTESYDEPLTFVCQIRCEDIAAFDRENLLPHTGMLYFFAPIDYFLGERDSPLDYHTPPAVIYSPTLEGLSPYEIHWEGTDESIFRPAEEIIFSAAEMVCDEGVLMLGRPCQDEVREAHEEEVCLLQIDEDDRWGLRFYDCGMYYIFMKAADIKAGKWHDASAELFYY